MKWYGLSVVKCKKSNMLYKGKSDQHHWWMTRKKGSQREPQ